MFDFRLLLVSLSGLWLCTACDERATASDDATNRPDAVQKSNRQAQKARRSERELTKSSRTRQWDARHGGDARYRRELERRTAALGGPTKMPRLTDPFDGDEFSGKVKEFINRSETGTLPGGLWSSVRFGIERLTADQNPEFDRLLRYPTLRQDEGLLPFLWAYDFQVTGDHEALDQLLEFHRAHSQGDSNSLAALMNIDDWEKTAKALYGPHANFDGAGGEALAIFMKVRRALYPENFERYEETIRWRPGNRS